MLNASAGDGFFFVLDDSDQALLTKVENVPFLQPFAPQLKICVGKLCSVTLTRHPPLCPLELRCLLIVNVKCKYKLEKIGIEGPSVYTRGSFGFHTALCTKKIHMCHGESKTPTIQQ